MHITPVHIKYKESLDTILYTVLGDIHLTLNKKWLFNSESLVTLLMFNLMIVIFYRSNGYYFADHFFFRFVKKSYHVQNTRITNYCKWHTTPYKSQIQKIQKSRMLHYHYLFSSIMIKKLNTSKYHASCSCTCEILIP